MSEIKEKNYFLYPDSVKDHTESEKIYENINWEIWKEQDLQSRSEAQRNREPLSVETVMGTLSLLMSQDPKDENRNEVYKIVFMYPNTMDDRWLTAYMMNTSPNEEYWKKIADYFIELETRAMTKESYVDFETFEKIQEQKGLKKVGETFHVHFGYMGDGETREETIGKIFYSKEEGEYIYCSTDNPTIGTENFDFDNGTYSVASLAHQVEVEQKMLSDVITEFRNFLVEKVSASTGLDLSTSTKNNFSHQANLLLADESRKLIKEKNTDFLSLVEKVINHGGSVYTLKEPKSTGLQSLATKISRGKLDTYMNDAEGTWTILTDELTFPLISENQRNRFIDKQWTEITEDRWWNALGEMPPLNHQSIEKDTFFYCAEAYTASIHTCYAEVDGKFYSAMKDRREGSYEEYRDEIKEQADSGTLKSTLDPVGVEAKEEKKPKKKKSTKRKR